MLALQRGRKARAFTLIELLIVVAIIAILAAIAVPNFLEAQIRAKCGRAVSDLRAISVALEIYRTDYTEYPSHTERVDSAKGLIPLSTPTAYMNNPLLPDPFKLAGTENSNRNLNLNYIYIAYRSTLNPDFCTSRRKVFGRAPSLPVVNGHFIKAGGELPPSIQWSLTSYGPDGKLQFDDDPLIGGGWDSTYMPYDATNGTKSAGDLHRLGP